MEKARRHSERIPLYLGAMLIALAGMTTNIYDVHARGCGIEKWAPWTRRVTAAVGRVTSVLRRLLTCLWTDHRPLLVTAAVLLCAALMHPHLAQASAVTVMAGRVDLKEFRGQREKLITDMRAILEKADTEKRGLSPDDNVKLERMKVDALALKQRITAEEELETEERALVPESQRQVPPVDERTAKRRDEFRQFMSSKTPPADVPGVRSVSIPGVGSGFQYDILPEQRSQNTLSLAGGGALVAPDTSMYGRIVEALKFFGGIEQVGSEQLTTDTGADLPMATDDDTANTGTIIPEESSQASGTNVTVGQVVLHAYLYSSKVVKVSWQLLQDVNGFDIDAYLGRKFGMRLGRIYNTHCTTGTGINQPQGLVTGATVGRQSATGNSTSVVADDVKRLIHSVDVAYRNPGCRFMMSDTAALAYELLKDGNGQYIWRDGGNLNGLTDTPSSSLAGYRVQINNDMPVPAASAKHTSFGDHSYYKQRRVRAIQIVRINELYVENGQVGFLAFMRADGGLVDAGQHPVKLLQNSAT